MSLITDMNLRTISPGDAHYILNVDLKASEFPWDIEDWQLMQRYFPDWKVMVGSMKSIPKAFSVVEFAIDEKLARVHKLVALPEAVRVGLDLLLLDAIEFEAVTKQLEHLEFIAPQTSCRGKNDPYDVSSWLLKHGFRCTETKEEMFEAYGDDFEAFLFHKPVQYGKYF